VEGLGFFLYASMDGSPSRLPKAFTQLVGECLKEHDLPFWTIGVAYTCDSYIVGSHGGTEFRIYQDGSIEYPELVYRK
jgi:hypothetical protein